VNVSQLKLRSKKFDDDDEDNNNNNNNNKYVVYSVAQQSNGHQ
jgi:hypothetical protein